MSETRLHSPSDDDWHYTTVELSRESIVIKDMGCEYVELDATQSLELLAWLQQEKATLEQMVREQKT